MLGDLQDPVDAIRRVEGTALRGGVVRQHGPGTLDVTAQRRVELGHGPAGGHGHDRAEMVAEQHLAGEAGIGHRGIVEMMGHRGQEHGPGSAR